MRHKLATSITAASLLITASTALSGCASEHATHQKWVHQADHQWRSMRSQLIYSMAKQRFDAGQLDQAEKSVKDGLEVAPDNPQLQLLAGQIALERGKLERAYHLFGSVIALDKKNDKAYYLQGIILQRWQQYKDAYQRYQQAYDLKKDNVGYLLAMAQMLVPLNRPNDAIKLLVSKKNYFDGDASIRAALGHLYMMQGDYKNAADIFQQAAMLSPDDIQIQQQLGFAQLQAGQAQAAVNTLQAVLNSPNLKDQLDVQRALAMAYQHTGRVDDARQLYITLTQNDRDDAMDWIKLAELCWRQGDMDATMQAAEQIMRIAPDKPDGYLLAGMVWQKRKQLTKALDMFDRAATLNPHSAEPLILRGISLEHAGRVAAAKQAYQEALRLDPADTRAKRLLSGL